MTPSELGDRNSKQVHAERNNLYFEGYKAIHPAVGLFLVDKLAGWEAGRLADENLLFFKKI